MRARAGRGPTRLSPAPSKDTMPHSESGLGTVQGRDFMPSNDQDPPPMQETWGWEEVTQNQKPVHDPSVLPWP